mmetsp:Transcript_127188/g.356195  ORF Transcript_127188/g.356195 Transcript_127188/m.356195 type:complete len:282 (-) Transcript_127188:68-913(-)
MPGALVVVPHGDVVVDHGAGPLLLLLLRVVGVCAVPALLVEVLALHGAVPDWDHRGDLADLSRHGRALADGQPAVVSLVARRPPPLRARRPGHDRQHVGQPEAQLQEALRGEGGAHGRRLAEDEVRGSVLDEHKPRHPRGGGRRRARRQRRGGEGEQGEELALRVHEARARPRHPEPPLGGGLPEDGARRPRGGSDHLHVSARGAARDVDEGGDGEVGWRRFRDSRAEGLGRCREARVVPQLRRRSWQAVLQVQALAERQDHWPGAPEAARLVGGVRHHGG